MLHVASPFPATRPVNEDELIVPARDGALRMLRAARDAGVRRVVLTSSFAAVGYGHDRPGRVFDAPAWLIRPMARLNPALREMVPQLNVVRRASNAKARTDLGWAPRSNEDAVTATGESLVRLGCSPAPTVFACSCPAKLGSSFPRSETRCIDTD